MTNPKIEQIMQKFTKLWAEMVLEFDNDPEKSDYIKWQKIWSEWLEKELTSLLEEREIQIGKMIIRKGMREGRIWLENQEGEGGDFPIKDLEKILEDYFNKNF